MGRSSTVIGKCGFCERAIFDDHPYTWCDGCGAPLPDNVKGSLPARVTQPREEPGVPLVVKERHVSCPICQHPRFYTSRKVVAGRGAVLMGWAFASATAETYICVSCGHMLWFMR